MLSDKKKNVRVVQFVKNEREVLTKNGQGLQLMKRYEPQQKFEIEDKKGWVAWGQDNLYPQYLNFLYRNEGLHKAIIRGKASMIAGNGVGLTQVDKILPEIAWNLALNEFATYRLYFT